MPAIRVSGNPNLQGWRRIQNPIATGQNRPSPLPTKTVGRSAFMLASMPSAVSTLDSFTRQFYSGLNVPQQRIITAGSGVTSRHV